MKTRCMIVDDEPLARRVLQKHIETLPSLELVKECGSAAEAAAFLHANAVDIMFLDIKMPGMTGLELLATLSSPPQVIVTTAYSEFALEGYEHSVTDYLLKPIALDRFVKAVNKAVNRIRPAGAAADGPADAAAGVPAVGAGRAAEPGAEEEYVFLRAEKTEHRVRYSAIRYVEGSGNFVKVFSDDGMIRAPETMTAVANTLPPDRFLRVHKSFVVAIDRIDRIEGNTITVGEDRVPIGKYYKKDVEQLKAAHRLKKGGGGGGD